MVKNMMELHISNLGKLKEARLDIRPLSVFIGPNHTNKTWTAYALYGIARNLARVEFSTHQRDLGFLPSPALRSRVESAGTDLLHALTRTAATEVRARVTREDTIRGLSPSDLVFSLDGQGIGHLLGLPDRAAPALAASKANLAIDQGEFRRSVYSALEVVYKPSSFQLECRFEIEDGSSQAPLYVFPLFGGKEPDDSTATIEKELRIWIVHTVGMLVYTILDDVAVLPAERMALLSANSANFLMMAGRKPAAFPLPLHDFLRMIERAARQSDTGDSNGGGFRSLAEILEARIIEGTIGFEDKERSGATGSETPFARGGTPGSWGRDLSYVRAEGVELAMHASASIVRALAGLDVYLKLFAHRGGFLVIDEPEMNAHPEAQLKIIEFLALMVRHGVRVVLTTHSPYIVDHLTNLMQASQLRGDARRLIAQRFKLGMHEAFLSPEEISIYLFTERGEVEDILDRDQGMIDLTSFSHPTEYMANLVNAIWRAADHDVRETVEQGHAV
jgi:hypothetical protein